MLKLHSQLAEQNAVRNDAFNKFSENRFKKLSPIYYGYDELKKQSENTPPLWLEATNSGLRAE